MCTLCGIDSIESENIRNKVMNYKIIYNLKYLIFL